MLTKKKNLEVGNSTRKISLGSTIWLDTNISWQYCWVSLYSYLSTLDFCNIGRILILVFFFFFLIRNLGYFIWVIDVSNIYIWLFLIFWFMYMITLMILLISYFWFIGYKELMEVANMHAPGLCKKQYKMWKID